MDNLTHTLTGLLIAETGLKRRTRLGAVTLMVGANLPDLDAAVFLVGDGLDGLGFRRGWTHGILAMAVLPVLLWLVMHWWATRRPDPGRPLDSRWLLVLATLGTWSHPLLDLFNTYGVRLLMPFSGRWFYGDTLFIVDPLVLATLAAGILLARWRDDAGLARAALLAAAIYVSLMAGGSALGRATVVAQGAGVASSTLTSPRPLAPLRRDVVRRLPGGYESGTVHLGLSPRYTPRERVTDGADAPWARWMAGTDRGGRFLAWSRYPRFVLDTIDGTPFGVIYDMRYGDGVTGTWASVEAELPADLTAP